MPFGGCQSRQLCTEKSVKKKDFTSSCDWNHMRVMTLRWQLDESTQQAQLLEEQLVQQLTHGWTDKEACQSFLDGILKSCKDNKLHLSTQVVASAAAYLAQQQWWSSLEDLLRAQALPSMAMCPGLTLTVVQGGQFSLLATVLPKVIHMSASKCIPCHTSSVLCRPIPCSVLANSDS